MHASPSPPLSLSLSLSAFIHIYPQSALREKSLNPLLLCFSPSLPILSTAMSTDLDFLQASLPPIKVETPLGTKIEPANEEASPCRTPTGAEHKIPVILTCPPAPRKPRRVIGCKRRLSEFDFFEVVHREEVEEFFRSSLEMGGAKRRCKYNGNKGRLRSIL